MSKKAKKGTAAKKVHGYQLTVDGKQPFTVPGSRLTVQKVGKVK